LFFYLWFKKTSKKVVVQSPPLLLSFIAVFILSLKNKKIILNVSDLWPLAAIELNALKKDSLSHKFSLFLERFIYKKSSLVLGQSNEIITHIKYILPNKKCYLYRNYPDHNVGEMELVTEENKPIKIFYAGLLGVAQGVLDLCKNIDLKALNAELHLFGDGAEKNQLEALLLANNDSKIYFHGMLERNELHHQIKTFDVAIVPLTTRIYGSVPSKIFEYAALGFPILYFGGGEGEVIVEENNLGWVAPVGDFEKLNQVLAEIALLSKTDLASKKKAIFYTAQTQFQLKKQIAELIDSDVF
jgi:glycosyltransferase involved in cell wall biosynthesis